MSPVMHRKEERPQESLRSSLYTGELGNGDCGREKAQEEKKSCPRPVSGLRLLAGDLRRLCPAAAAILAYGVVTHLLFDRFLPHADSDGISLPRLRYDAGAVSGTDRPLCGRMAVSAADLRLDSSGCCLWNAPLSDKKTSFCPGNLYLDAAFGASSSVQSGAVWIPRVPRFSSGNCGTGRDTYGTCLLSVELKGNPCMRGTGQRRYKIQV